MKKSLVGSAIPIQTFESFSKSLQEIAPPFMEKYYKLSKNDMKNARFYAEKLSQDIHLEFSKRRESSLKKRLLETLYAILGIFRQLVIFMFLGILINQPFSMIAARMRKWYCKNHPCIPRPEDRQVESAGNMDDLNGLDFDNLGQDDSLLSSSRSGRSGSSDRYR